MNKEAEFLVKVAYLRGQADAQNELYRKGYIKEAANWWPKLQSSLSRLFSKSAPESVNFYRHAIGEGPVINPITSGVRKVIDTMKDNTVPIAAGLGGAGLGALGGELMDSREDREIQEEFPDLAPYLGSNYNEDTMPEELLNKYLVEKANGGGWGTGAALGALGGAGLGAGGAILGPRAKDLLKKLLKK